MFIDLKSRASQRITIQLPMSYASPRFPATTASVRRSKQVKSQAQPVPVMKDQSFPPVLTIHPGESITLLPAAILSLEPIKNAITQRLLVASKPYKPAPEPEVSQPATGVSRRRRA